MPRRKQSNPERQLVASAHSRTCDACGYGMLDDEAECFACAQSTTFPWDPRSIDADKIEECLERAACELARRLPQHACAYCGRAPTMDASVRRTMLRGKVVRVLCDAACEVAFHAVHVIVTISAGMESVAAAAAAAADASDSEL